MSQPHTISCTFETERLIVADWHELAEAYSVDLVTVVPAIMTARTTEALPPAWQGDYDDERAAMFITERDAESPTLLTLSRQSRSALGLLFLFEDASATLRLGYVFAEAAWGRGLGTELLKGLVGWTRHQKEIESLIAGVEETNTSSIRVLEKAGFERIPDSGEAASYRWSR